MGDFTRVKSPMNFHQGFYPSGNLHREQGGTHLLFDREARAGGEAECYCEPMQEVTKHLHRQSAGPMPYFPDWGNIPPSKRGSSKARGRRKVGEAVEGGEKGQLDGKLAGARISKGRKMPNVNVIYILFGKTLIYKYFVNIQ